MFSRRHGLLIVLIVFMSLAGLLVVRRPAEASFLTHRDIIEATAQPGVVTTHDFQFDVPSTNLLGSIVMEYCNSPVFDYPCTPPTGLDVGSAVLAGQTGNTGFSIDTADSTTSKIVLTRTPAAGIINHSTYNFSNMKNPTALGSVFIRLSTHSSTDGSGAIIDSGAVAYAVQNNFEVDTYVPPFLNFCVGVTVAPDCSVTVGNNIDLGELSPSHYNAGTTQFSTATNDPSGYNIFVLGTTMTSGNDIIDAVTTPSPSSPGHKQFGINLRSNLSPPVGQEPLGVGTGVPTVNYNQVNRFMFNSGDNIASSPLTTNYNRMTVSYLVNIIHGQPAGIYATTLTYVATVQF